jgi:FtsP/CotA-like multicopper oxidase with cupredoxin domain
MLIIPRYHSHSREQIGDRLWGGLVIHKPAEIENEQSYYGYDEKMLLLIGDWFHHPAEELMTKYLHWSSAGAEPVPDSMLINGAGSFNCSMLIRTSNFQCTEVARPHLKANKGKKYRFRVVNVGYVSHI